MIASFFAALSALTLGAWILLLALISSFVWGTVNIGSRSSPVVPGICFGLLLLVIFWFSFVPPQYIPSQQTLINLLILEGVMILVYPVIEWILGSYQYARKLRRLRGPFLENLRRWRVAISNQPASPTRDNFLIQIGKVERLLEDRNSSFSVVFVSLKELQNILPTSPSFDPVTVTVRHSALDSGLNISSFRVNQGEINPKLSENKENCFLWAVFWPMYFLNRLLGDILQLVLRYISPVKLLRSVLDKITEWFVGRA